MTLEANHPTLDAARALQTELATSDIVNRVGYGSDAAFSRAFKREYGVPPSKIRRQAQQLLAAKGA